MNGYGYGYGYPQPGIFESPGKGGHSLREVVNAYPKSNQETHPQKPTIILRLGLVMVACPFVRKEKVYCKYQNDPGEESEVCVGKPD